MFDIFSVLITEDIFPEKGEEERNRKLNSA
jgi:hypothetical protein